MKLKRIFSFLFILIFAFSTVPAVTTAATNQYTSPELKRAVSLGIGTYAKNTTVTYKQFFKMLDAAVKLSDPKKLTAWKKKFPKARASSKTMNRQEGMLALYFAAETLGEEFCSYNKGADWGLVNDKIGSKCWDEITMDYPLFPGWEKPVTIVNHWDNYMIAAYFYSFARESQYSGKSVLDYDPVSNSMRTKAPFKYEEALLAALRLHDSNPEMEKRMPNQADKAFLKQADERLAAILNSRTEVKVTGTAYYVSNNGSDANDGLSSATAWATLKKVNTTPLKPGDGVFFQRGGLWRSEPWQGMPGHCGNGVLYAQNGVTYSAYGTGEKPKLFGSPENGADQAKWTLLAGTKNIWVFYHDIQDCGGILLNGDTMAQKTCAFWKNNRYWKSTSGSVVDTPKVAFDVKKLENERFFNEITYPEKSIAGYFSLTGKLYFRCDKGNPGSVYKSMEFLTGNNDWNQGFSSGLDGCVFDNLCFLYGTGLSVVSNCTVQNCEVGWTGGQLLDFGAESLGDDTQGVIVRCGDGIANYGKNNIIRNNYVHHTYDHGITIEGFAADPAKTAWERDHITITDNLIDHCFGCITIADWYAWEKKLKLPSFNNINIAGNYFLRSGYSWSHQNADSGFGSVTMYLHPGSSKNILISNNVFYLSKFYLINLKYTVANQKPSFSDNTYVQDSFGKMFERVIETADSQDVQEYQYKPYALAKTAFDALGDKTARFFDK